MRKTSYQLSKQESQKPKAIRGGERKVMKKSLSLVLAIAMVFSMFSSMAFAGENQSAGEYLQSIGVVKGTLSGDLQENDTWSRQDVTVILSRLMGAEAEAAATAKAHTFADVTNPFYDGYISWAKAEGLFNGHSDVRFGYEESISNQQFLAVMTRALGYSFDYNNVVEEAIALGLVDAGIDAKAEATRGSYYNVVVQTLHTVTADGQVLGNKLSLEGFAPAVAEYAVVDSKNIEFTLSNGEVVAVELEEALVANTETEVTFEYEGTEYTVAVTWEVTELIVESVTGSNLKELVVKFNNELNADTVKVANFKVGGVDAAAVSLGEDKKTVTVTIAAAQIASTQPADYKVVIDKVEDVAGDAVTKTEQTVRVLDADIPAVTGMELTGPKTIELTFSEPIKTAPTVKVNNGIYGVTVGAVGSTKIVVTLAASSLPEGDYEVAISGYKDYAGLAGDTAKLTLNYVKDTTAPVASIKSVTGQTTVVVKFDKPVTLDATNNGGADAYEDYFYHTFSAWAPDSVSKNATDTEFTLTFTTYPLPAGAVNLVVKAKGSAGVEITDKWGNKIGSNSTLAVSVTADNTAPTVTNVKVVDEDTVELYFSEDMDEAKAETVANYAVKDADGKDVTTVVTPTYTEDASKSEYKVTLQFASKLAGGNYTVDVKNQEDEALAPNALATVTLAFTITDKTPIDPVANADDFKATIVPGAADADGEVFYVTFSEKMATEGEYSVLRSSNYMIAGAALPSGATLELFGSTGKVVKITTSNIAVTPGTTQISISRLADAAGNVMAAFSHAEAIQNEDAPAVTGVKQTDVNKLTITVDKALASVVASAFVTNDVYEVAAIESWTVNSNGTTTIVAVVTGDAVTSAVGAQADFETNTSRTFGTIDVVGQHIVSETGKKGNNQTDFAVTDARAPKIAGATSIVAAAGEEIEITFSENLDATAALVALYAQDLVVMKGSTTLVAGVDYTTSVAGAVLTVDIVSGANATDKVTIKTKDSITYITDGTNKATAYTTAKEVTLLP